MPLRLRYIELNVGIDVLTPTQNCDSIQISRVIVFQL